MANAKVGTITYDAVINTDGLDSGASKVKSVLGNVGKVAAAAVAAGAIATAGLVVASVKAFAEYEQLVGGVDKLFGKSSDTVQKYAEEAFRTAGLSANQYMETVTGFSASLISGLGGDTKKAAEIANMAVTDMADNANVFGSNIQDIQNAYQGFAKQNFTMLDNLKLGYGGTASEMARLVNDAGLMNDGFVATAQNVKDIPFDMMIQSINQIQQEMDITGTTAKEASETISGAFNSTKAAWENVLTAFGTGNNEMIKAAIDGLIESAMNLVTNISVIIPQILAGIGQLVTAFAAELPAILTTMVPILIELIFTAIDVIITAIPQLIDAGVKLIVGLVQGLAKAIPKIIPAIVAGIKQILTTIVENLPLLIDAGIELLQSLTEGLVDAIPQLIPAVIEAIMVIIEQIIRLLPELIIAGVTILVALVKGLADALPKLIKYIPEIINTLITELTKPSVLSMLIMAAIDIMMAISKGLFMAIPDLIFKVVPALTIGLVTALLNLRQAMQDVGLDLIKGLWNGIKDATGWILGKIKGFGESIMGGIKSFFGIKSPSRLFRDQVGKNLALGIGEGFSSEMDDVTKDMQNAIPTPEIDVDTIGQVQVNNDRQPIIIKVGEETIATKIIELINDRSRLSGQNAIMV